jgi:PDZ domain
MMSLSSSLPLLISGSTTTRSLFLQSTASLVAMLVTVYILGMVLGALLLWCYAGRRCRAPVQDEQSRALELRAKESDNVETSSSMDEYTTSTTVVEDTEWSHPLGTATRPPPRDESFLSALTAEPISSWIYNGNEEAMEGFSISGMDVGTLEPTQLDQEQTQQKSVVSSFSRPSDTTLPLVVQRTLKAPPGRLGLTLAVTSDGPKVRSIRKGSPVEGLLFVGDIVVAINDTDTRTLSIPSIYNLLQQSNDLQRSITVLTMDDTARNGLFLC